MTPLSPTKAAQAEVGGMFLPITSSSAGVGNFLPGTPPATPTPTSRQGKRFEDQRWEEARSTAVVVDDPALPQREDPTAALGEGEGSISEDGNAVGEEEQAAVDVEEDAKLDSNQLADDVVVEARHELGQRMLSPEGLLVKKVLRQGIAYPVRLRLLLQQRKRRVFFDDIDDHQGPPFSLSLTWLEGDDCGLDLSEVTSVRPVDHSSNTRLEDISGPRDHKAVNIEQDENAEDSRHHKEGAMYDRHARGRRADSNIMLLLAWDLERETGLGIDKTVVSCDSSPTLLQLEAASEQERDALVGCFQQLVSELRRGWEGREDDTWSVAGSSGEPEDKDDCNSSSVAAGTQGDRTVVQNSGFPEGFAEASEQTATSTTTGATTKRERAGEGKPPAGGGVRCRKTPHRKARKAEADGVGDRADPASSEESGIDGDRSSDAEESNGLRRKTGAKNCSALKSRQQQCEASHPAGSPKSPTTTTTTTEIAQQHNNTADATRRPSASRLPPRGTQRYWSVGDVATKLQILRRRRSAGVRTPSGQYIGGNLSRGASLGPRNSVFLSSASLGAEIGQAGWHGGELFWERAVLEQRKQELSARILRLHDRWKDDSRVAAWAVGVMELKRILGQAAARHKQKRWERWCAVVSRANRGRMLSDRRLWWLHAMANRENDLQAWYHSVCPEVYRRKRRFWCKYAKLKRFGKVYRMPPDEPLTALERRLMSSCETSPGTRDSDILFHLITAQEVLTSEERHLFQNLMQRDVAVPRGASEAGRRRQYPHLLRLLFNEGRLDLMWTDQLENTKTFHNLGKIKKVLLTPTRCQGANTRRQQHAEKASVISTTSSFGSGSSSEHSVLEGGAHKGGSAVIMDRAAGGGRVRGRVRGIDSILYPDLVSPSSAASIPTATGATAPLISQNSPDSIASSANQGRGIAGLATRRNSLLQEESVPESGAESDSRRLAGTGTDCERHDQERGCHSGDLQKEMASDGVASGGHDGQQKEAEKENSYGRGGEVDNLASEGWFLAVHFVTAPDRLELWFPTEQKAKTWKRMLKELALKERGFTCDDRREKNQRAPTIPTLPTPDSLSSGGTISNSNDALVPTSYGDRRQQSPTRTDSAAPHTMTDNRHLSHVLPAFSGSTHPADLAAGVADTLNRHQIA